MRFLRLNVVVLFVAMLAMSHLVYAEDVGSSSQDANANISKRLLTIDQQLRSLAENQKQIAAKNKEIEEQLKSLRVWIFRRGGGSSS